jgi:hypothetical protein
MRYRLRIAAAVWLQAEAIDSWWYAYRPAAPMLFREELEAALERLETAPLTSTAYSKQGQSPDVRRLMLPRSARSVPFASRLETVAQRWANRYALSPAETDVLIGAALGEDRETIARRRESTLGTVKSQVEKLIDKTGDVGLLEAANRLVRESQH